MTSPAPPVREARLRAEFADQYPGIDPGVWYNAATLAEHLDGRRARADDSRPPAALRSIPPEHFDFRGGEKPVGVRAVLGRRSGD